MAYQTNRHYSLATYLPLASGLHVSAKYPKTTPCSSSEPAQPVSAHCSASCSSIPSASSCATSQKSASPLLRSITPMCCLLFPKTARTSSESIATTVAPTECWKWPEARIPSRWLGNALVPMPLSPSWHSTTNLRPCPYPICMAKTSPSRPVA